MMADETTARLALPLLQAGQAQKEIVHNEALLRLDSLTQSVVGAVGTATPPDAPAIGQAWVVGAGAADAWAGHDDAIAAWGPGGWRFLAPFEGLTAWSIADAGVARYLDGEWRVAPRAAPVADPSGGAVVDGEARAALAAVLRTLRLDGRIAP